MTPQCYGTDALGSACNSPGIWNGLCYFHDKIKSGLLTDYHHENVHDRLLESDEWICPIPDADGSCPGHRLESSVAVQ
jgi:hypothetical protein